MRGRPRRRPVSTTAPQALTFLNGAFMRQQARHFADRLHKEAIQRGAEHAIVIEARAQPLVDRDLGRVDAVDDPLVQVGRAQSPDFAAEVDVVAVVGLA